MPAPEIPVCIVPDGVSNNVSIVTGYNGREGKALIQQTTVNGKIKNKVLMDEIYKDRHPEFAALTSQITGKVLFVGLGLGQLASAVEDIVVEMDFIEINQDVATMVAPSYNFTNQYVGDILTFVFPDGKKWDKIVIDSLHSKGYPGKVYDAKDENVQLNADYQERLQAIKDICSPLLEVDGQLIINEF